MRWGSLNLFLVMSVKSSLSKSLLISLLVLFSCSKRDLVSGVYHTELICPDMGIILIRYSTLNDVRAAIKRAYQRKKSARTNEKYTVIAFAENRSLKIDNLLPEDAVKCDLREIYHPRKDSNKSKYRSPGHSFWGRH
jgi:hypothetical protein